MNGSPLGRTTKILRKNKLKDIKKFRVKKEPAVRAHQPYLHGDVRPGDLVRITTYDWEGSVNKSHGIITATVTTPQLSMFPLVSVYIFERQVEEEIYSYNIEVVSRP